MVKRKTGTPPARSKTGGRLRSTRMTTRFQTRNAARKAAAEAELLLKLHDAITTTDNVANTVDNNVDNNTGQDTDNNNVNNHLPENVDEIMAIDQNERGQDDNDNYEVIEESQNQDEQQDFYADFSNVVPPPLLLPPLPLPRLIQEENIAGQTPQLPMFRPWNPDAASSTASTSTALAIPEFANNMVPNPNYYANMASNSSVPNYDNLASSSSAPNYANTTPNFPAPNYDNLASSSTAPNYDNLASNFPASNYDNLASNFSGTNYDNSASSSSAPNYDNLASNILNNTDPNARSSNHMASNSPANYENSAPAPNSSANYANTTPNFSDPNYDNLASNILNNTDPNARPNNNNHHKRKDEAFFKKFSEIVEGMENVLNIVKDMHRTMERYQNNNFGSDLMSKVSRALHNINCFYGEQLSQLLEGLEQ